MTDAEKGKRIAELVAKSQAGKATAQEIQELNGLMSGAAADLKSGKQLTNVPTQADMDKAMQDEAARRAAKPQLGTLLAQGVQAATQAGPGGVGMGTPPPVAPPAPQPQPLIVNPELLAPIGLASTPSGQISRASDGQTGRENPALYPESKAILNTQIAATPKEQKTAVQKLIEGLQAEEKVKDGKPNIWDFIEAGAAGWQGKTPAYIEKQRAAEERAADIAKLEKTAQMQEAIDIQKNRADVVKALVAAGRLPMSALEEIGITGIQGIGGVSRGTAAGNTLVANLGGD